MPHLLVGVGLDGPDPRGATHDATYHRDDDDAAGVELCCVVGCCWSTGRPGPVVGRGAAQGDDRRGRAVAERSAPTAHAGSPATRGRRSPNSTVYVRAELPTIRYAGRPAYFKTQLVLDASGTPQRLQLRMPVSMRRFVQRRLPAQGVVMRPFASVRGGSGPARADAVRLLP